MRWAPSGLVTAKRIIPLPEEGVKLLTPAIPRNAGHGTSRIERHCTGGLMYNVTPRISTGGRPLPEEPRDPEDHEAHSDVSGGLASRVLLDRDHATATKRYRPPLVVKVLYWLAFQAPFPYVRNEPALQAAKARRTIASQMAPSAMEQSRQLSLAVVVPSIPVGCASFRG